MKLRSVSPYGGNEDYITLIFSEEDAAQAEALIRRPVLQGYRIWYEDSDHPEPERIETIRQKLAGCAVCVALVSARAVNSHVFRSGLTSATLSGKPILLVFEAAVQLSLGMRLQAAAATEIRKYELDEEAFYGALFAGNEIRRCRAAQAAPLAAAMWLEREKNKEIILLRPGATTFGRSASVCDYVIDSNNYVGRFHATIINSDGCCVIIDNNSKNRTYVNAKLLAPAEQVRLTHGDIIMMANEKFTFYWG